MIGTGQDAGAEHALWQDDKALWAILLFMKYTHKKTRWHNVRAVIRQELTEAEDERIRGCWKLAKQERRI